MNKLTITMMAAGMAMSGLSLQAQRQCSTQEHLQHLISQYPEVQEEMDAIETHTAAYTQAMQSAKMDAAATINIPVVVHVLYNVSAENISDAQIRSQIDVLNEDFRKLNADRNLIPTAFSTLAADAGINFCLASVDPNGATTTGITRTSTTVTAFADDDRMKSSSTGGKSPWPADKYLNIWVCDLGSSLLGYAQFPGGPASTDGVVIHYKYFGRGGSAVAPFNKGRTGTHEVGHWLNLRHIWGDANCGNDLVSDTPTQQTSNYSCPSFPHVTCSNGPNGDMFMNYMDYVDDACMYMFSNGQKTRMQALFSAGGARASLATSNGCSGGTTTGCGTPGSLSASGVSTSGATLNWAAVSGANSYAIRYKKTSTTTWTTTSATTTSKAISGLTNGTTYEFQVQAVCGTSSGSFSGSATFTTGTSGTNYTVGSGTLASVAPYGTYYMDERCQFIVTKAELQAAGYNGTASVLKSLGFNVTSNAGQVMNAFTIKIRHTTSSAFSTSSFMSTTGSTTVYSGNVSPVSGWNTHAFSTSFAYNGIDNVLIDICWNNASYTSDTKVASTTLTANRCLYSQVDNTSSGNCGATSGTLSLTRPNIRFGFGTTATALNPESDGELPSTARALQNSSSLIYPNPTHQSWNLNIERVQGTALSVELYTLDGKRVWAYQSNETTESRSELRIQPLELGLADGMYFCVIQQGEQRQTEKLVYTRE